MRASIVGVEKQIHPLAQHCMHVYLQLGRCSASARAMRLDSMEKDVTCTCILLARRNGPLYKKTSETAETEHQRNVTVLVDLFMLAREPCQCISGRNHSHAQAWYRMQHRIPLRTLHIFLRSLQKPTKVRRSHLCSLRALHIQSPRRTSTIASACSSVSDLRLQMHK